MANSQDVGLEDNGLPGFHVDKFKAYMNKTGNLPVNRFYVELVMPPIMSSCPISVNGQQKTFSQAFGRDVAFRAESVRAPGVAINFTNVNRYGVGPMQKFPYNAQFTDLSMSFLADKESMIWIFFYNWLNNIFKYSSNDEGPMEDASRYRANYMVDYATEIYLHVYHYNGELSTTLKLIDAYPVSMNDVALSWDTNNQLMRITVTFTFRTWKMENVQLQDCFTTPVSVPRLSIPKYSQPITEVKPERPGFTLGVSTPDDPNALDPNLPNAYTNGLAGVGGLG